jgi:uncharacterized RDD family membrane protein YckC
MQRKTRRTLIDISTQPGLDFSEQSEHTGAEFVHPGYQRALLASRAYALGTDLMIVFAMFIVFLGATLLEMPSPATIDGAVLGVYASSYLILFVVYMTLFMLSASQTAGMRIQGLIAVDRDGQPLKAPDALFRAFGYLISTLPMMFGFLWAGVDPEHLTWADRVSGTFVKRV